MESYEQPSYNRSCDDDVRDRRASGSTTWLSAGMSTAPIHPARSTNMSIINQARRSAGATVEQGKSTVGAVSSRIQTLPAGTRDLTRSALTLARRQAYATIGASDAIVATVTRQRKVLPVQAKRNATNLVETTKSRVTVATETVQKKIATAANGLTERSADVVTSARKNTPAATIERVKDAAEERRGQAQDAYAKLTVRGEQVATDLRHDPVLVRLIRNADTRVENVANGVTSVAQKVRTRAQSQAKRESAATTSTPVRVTPANKVPTHRTTVRNTPAAEAAVSTIPTHRAAAFETATRQKAAKKAAATRKAEAEQAAATRKAAAKKAAATRKAAALEAATKREAAAKKAAATRKKTAAARDQAAKTRQAAAVKAAATRKKNSAQA
jgi:hypothetical protein